jgi:hypothetical protein
MVDHVVRAGADRSFRGDTVFIAQFITDRGKTLVLFGIDSNLRYAITVSHIYKKNPAVISLTVNPSVKDHTPARVAFSQRSAIGGSFHRFHFNSCDNNILFPFFLL